MTTHKSSIKVLMVVATSVVTDTRVLREAQSLVDDGYCVEIVGRNVPEDYVPPKGIKTYSASSGPGLRPPAMGSLKTKRLSPHLRAIRWFLLPQHRARSFQAWVDSAYVIACGLKFDVVHAHDFTALGLGSRLSHEHNVPLIYDSHEWWLGRQRQYRATPLTDRREARLERELGREAAAVITVGGSIAELMESERGFKNVSVVRNSFPSFGDTSKKVVSPPHGIIYAGRIDAYRELEVEIAAAPEIPIPICWMGDHDNQWAAKHVPLARQAGIEVLSSQPIHAVTTAMQNAGLAFVTHSNLFESHRLAMPNKLFHAVQAGVPVIATDVTELGRIVRHYDIGELYEPGDSHSMISAIQKAIARHAELLDNVRAAQSELSWDHDAEVLRSLYRSTLAGHR
ncbi:MAG TPA: glycosyltransferase family 4 protein [Candidatus Nanopelagicaceae bacterium]